MKTGNTWVRLLVAGMALATLTAWGADTNVVSDQPFIADVDGGVTYVAGVDGMITVNFAAQSTTLFPQYYAATVVADDSGENAIFGGDYLAAGVKGMSFKIRSEYTVTKPVSAMVVLQGASGRLWRYEAVVVSTQGQEWVVNNISFDREAGWIREGPGDLDLMWQEDLRDVDVIGVRLHQPGFSALSYSIADFRLSGENFRTAPAVLSPLEKALKDRFGVTTVSALTDAQKAEDLDKDGMADMVEILSEHDDAFAASIFAAEMVLVDENGVLIKWPCVDGGVYTVFRSDSLLAPFAALPDATGLVAAETGFMSYLDKSALSKKSYFYKIRRDQ